MKEQQVQHRTQEAYKARADVKRLWFERLADWMVTKFGTFWFLLINIIFVGGWITVNLLSKWPFDAYPFNLLNTIITVEAVFVTIFVLITQNREQKIAHTRDEIDLQVNLITEQELTRLAQLVVSLMEHQGIKVKDDPQLKSIIEPTDPRSIEKTIEEQIP